jgi:hypothetical protein
MPKKNDARSFLDRAKVKGSEQCAQEIDDSPVCVVCRAHMRLRILFVLSDASLCPGLQSGLSG